MLLVLVFLLGLTYNVVAYQVYIGQWASLVPMGVFPSSILFFEVFFNDPSFITLLSFLLIFLYVFGVTKMAEKTQEAQAE